MSENQIEADVLLAASKKGIRLLRNNIGVARETNCKCKIQRYVKYGVGGEGGSDWIGYEPIVITPEMVGQTIAQFVVCEVKDPNKKTKKSRLELQKEFQATVAKFGGKAIWATSAADVY